MRLSGNILKGVVESTLTCYQKSASIVEVIWARACPSYFVICDVRKAGWSCDCTEFMNFFGVDIKCTNALTPLFGKTCKTQLCDHGTLKIVVNLAQLPNAWSVVMSLRGRTVKTSNQVLNTSQVGPLELLSSCPAILNAIEIYIHSHKSLEEA